VSRTGSGSRCRVHVPDLTQLEETAGELSTVCAICDKPLSAVGPYDVARRWEVTSGECRVRVRRWIVVDTVDGDLVISFTGRHAHAAAVRVATLLNYAHKDPS